uniref:SAM domain-containing protein n=1 Tax=Mesocestoides corti TaxID=53468 RepID=A0A5K3EXR1_MESCO
MSVLEKQERPPLHQPYRGGTKSENLQASVCYNRSGSGSSSEMRKDEDRPKFSSFLYSEQFCGDKSNRMQPTQKRHLSEAFVDAAENKYLTTEFYKKPKITETTQSIDDGSTSTCSEEEKDFVMHNANNRKPFSPQPVSSASPFFGFPEAPLLKPPQSRRSDDYQTLPASGRGDLPGQSFFNSLKPPAVFSQSPDDENDVEDGSSSSIGSELIVAAYNNFVRKLVDETLDRTVTFCEQPRNAISALERICSKAWPQLETKRHRNRIRAYLKACRRNSKKNRGQINMKEPPMNGLSVEARQMVATALNLVMKDIEQLRQDLKRDNSPSVFTAKNGTLPPNLRRHGQFCPTSNNSKSLLGCVPHTTSSTASPYSTATSSKSTHRNASTDDRHYPPTKSTYHLPPPLPPFPPPAGLDADCVSAIMRFLPSTFHFGVDLGASFRSAAMHTAMLMNSGLTTREHAADEEAMRNRYWAEGKREKREVQAMLPPPAAHFAVSKYSPTLNEATSMLLDVRPLSQVRTYFTVQR